MNLRLTNKSNRSAGVKNQIKVATILLGAVSALPAMGQTALTISQIEAQAPTTPTLDPSTISAIISQAGDTIDGYTYTKWAFLANDGTGSMDVYGTLPAGSTETPTIGDEITATGTYSPYEGVPELETLTQLSKTGTTTSVPSALTYTIPEINQLATTVTTAASVNNAQGYLITVDDVTLTGSNGATTINTPGNSTTLYATDTTGINSLEVYMYYGYSACGALAAANPTVPTEALDITGLVEVYKGTAELVPVSWAPTQNTGPQPIANNTVLSALTLSNQTQPTSGNPDGITSVTNNGKTVSAVVGTLVNIGTASAPDMVYAVLKYGTAVAPLNLGSSGGNSGDLTYYSAVPDGGHGGPVSGSTYPIPTGGTGAANVGYSTLDTATPGATLNGSLQLQNSNNGADSTIHVTLNPVQVLETRELNAYSSTSGAPVGDVLVGQSGTLTNVPLATVNTDTTAANALTDVTLLANSTSEIYTQKDGFTDASVANIQASAPGADQVFGGPNQSSVYGASTNGGTSTNPAPGTYSLSNGTVNVTVSPLISGTYGDDNTRIVGSTTVTDTATYTSFSGSAEGVVGMGLGDDPSIDVYAQYSGFQPAAVTASGSVAANNVVLTNAATNDNIATEGTSTGNFGIRDSAWVTSSSGNQDGWSSNLSAATPGASGGTDNPGTTISGSQSIGDSNSYSQSVSITYNASAALAGSYSGGTFAIGLENGQVDQAGIGDGAENGVSNVILGATHNDLAPVLLPLPNETGTGTGGGAYNFGGGTFIASGTTNLTGSFTQTGGTATFNKITGTGAMTITAGKSVLAAGHTSNTLASLSISGTGLLDVTNNTLTVSGGNLAAITALVASGRGADGAWDGATGIISSSAAAKPGTTVGVGTVAGGVKIMYTWLGDLDLDGAVTDADLTALNYGESHGLTGWANGDLNYDGTINNDDYSLFMLGAAAAGAKNISSVPEPTLVSAFALAGLVALKRRRRA